MVLFDPHGQSSTVEPRFLVRFTRKGKALGADRKTFSIAPAFGGLRVPLSVIDRGFSPINPTCNTLSIDASFTTTTFFYSNQLVLLIFNSYGELCVSVPREHCYERALFSGVPCDPSGVPRASGRRP